MSGLPMSWPASSLTLAIDGSTPGPSVALVRGDDVVVETTVDPEPRRGRRLMEIVHSVMEEGAATPSDLGGVVVGVGPGGFTGLRIALATAGGIAQGQGVPLVGASSLEAIALGIERADPGAEILAPATDARRREVFSAAYRRGADGALDVVSEPAARSPEDFAAILTDLGGPPAVVGAGTGYTAYGEALGGRARLAGSAHPAASHLVALVRAGGGRAAAPDYLRLPDAEATRRRSEAG